MSEELHNNYGALSSVYSKIQYSLQCKVRYSNESINRGNVLRLAV